MAEVPRDKSHPGRYDTSVRGGEEQAPLIDEKARGFVNALASKANLAAGGDVTEIAKGIGQQISPSELWNIVNELDTAKAIEPHTYDELKHNTPELEKYIKGAAAKQSRYRARAVAGRIKARVGARLDSHLAQLYEEEANLYDAVAVQTGQGAVERYRHLVAGTEDPDSSLLRQYLMKHYRVYSGAYRKELAAKAALATGKEPPPGAPSNLYHQELLLALVKGSVQEKLAMDDFEEAYGYIPAVEALVRQKTILESSAWSSRKEALKAAINPRRRLWGKGKIASQSLVVAHQARIEAYAAGNTAVTNFLAYCPEFYPKRDN